MLKSWGIPDTGFLTELKTHYCTEDEINDIEGTKTNSTFYPISKLSSIDVKAYIGRFKCLDEPEKLVLRGNYDTQVASNLMVVFDKCNNVTTEGQCKSEEEIQAFMEYKYLMSIVNTRRFM